MTFLLLALFACGTQGPAAPPSGAVCPTPCASDSASPPSGTPTGDTGPAPLAEVFAVGAWAHANFGASIATGDWDGDGLDEVVVGAPSLTSPLYDYDEWRDGGAVVLLEEDLTGATVLRGGLEARSAGERVLLVPSPEGLRLVTQEVMHDFGSIYVVDPALPYVDDTLLEEAAEASISGAREPGLEERVRYLSLVRGDVWVAALSYDDPSNASGRLVRVGLPFEAPTTLDAETLGMDTPGGSLGFSVVGTAHGTVVSQQVGSDPGRAHWFDADATEFSPSLATRTWDGPHPSSYFGIAVAALVDEGRTLAVVSATGDDSDYPRGGRVYVLDPDAADPSLAGAVATIHAGEAGTWMGYALLPGDFDGDGIDDLVVSAPADPYTSDDPGAVYAFRGPLRGDLTPADADWAWLGAQDRELTGSALASGDFDGDGALDLLIGSLGYDAPGADGAGRVDRVLNTEMGWN